jgi:hypothetical protein
MCAWLPSQPSIRVTTNARDAKNAISPALPVQYIGQTTVQRLNPDYDINPLTPHVDTQVGDLLFVIGHGVYANATNPRLFSNSGWTTSAGTVYSPYGTGNVTELYSYKFATGSDNTGYVDANGIGASLIAATMFTFRNVHLTSPFTLGTVFNTNSNGLTSIGPVTGLTVPKQAVCLLYGYCPVNSASTPNLTFTPVSGDGLTWNTTINNINVAAPSGQAPGSLYYAYANTSYDAVTVSSKTMTRSSGSVTLGVSGRGMVGRMIVFNSVKPD